MEQGIVIDGYITSKAKVTLIDRTKNISSFDIVIHEGRNRQIRKMLEELGHRVFKLERLRIHNLTAEGLNYGEYRNMTDKEISLLKNMQ